MSPQLSLFLAHFLGFTRKLQFVKLLEIHLLIAVKILYFKIKLPVHVVTPEILEPICYLDLTFSSPEQNFYTSLP